MKAKEAFIPLLCAIFNTFSSNDNENDLFCV